MCAYLCFHKSIPKSCVVFKNCIYLKKRGCSSISLLILHKKNKKSFVMLQRSVFMISILFKHESIHILGRLRGSYTWHDTTKTLMWNLPKMKKRIPVQSYKSFSYMKRIFYFVHAFYGTFGWLLMHKRQKFKWLILCKY